MLSSSFKGMSVVQLAWPSLFHSSGVRTSTMIVFKDFVVSLGLLLPSAIATDVAEEFSVVATFTVGELHATAYKVDAVIKNAKAIFFIIAKFILFLWIRGD